MSKLHALHILGHDPEGDRYRHELVLEEVSGCAELCAECGGFAATQHPRAAKRPELYRGIEVIRRCRGIALCSEKCLVAHAVRHDRALQDQETREAEAAGARKRRVA